MSSIAQTNADGPFVLAIDIGSSSVRALLHDGQGRQLSESECQLPYKQVIHPDGGSESDPATLLDLTARCIDGAVQYAREHSIEIAAVGATCFWHGLMGVTRDGTPTTPVYMWSDKRSGADALALADELDPGEVHQATGCRLHSSYWPAKLRWLKRTDCETFGRTALWVSVTDFIAASFFGEMRTSISMASGTGLLNTSTLSWDGSIAEALGIATGQLPVIVDRNEPYSDLKREWRKRWPTLGDIPWYPAIGDGAAANVGAGCVGRSRIAMTIGTSAAMRLVVADETERAGNALLPPRIWCYRLDGAHRVLGGALSNGGNVTGWLADRLAGGEFDGLTTEAESIAPDGHGLTMLPFLAGERSPSWNDRATGAIVGFRLSSTSGDMFRVALESTAYRLAAIYDDLKTLAAHDHQIHANGAAALGSPLWLQIIADTLGHSIGAVDAEAEASARGAAICALESLGALTTLVAADYAVARTYEPDPPAHRTYVAARVRQSRLEDAISMVTQSTGSDI